MRSRRFNWALNCLKGIGSLDNDPEKNLPIVLPADWQSASQSMQEKVSSCLAPYLYAPFVENAQLPGMESPWSGDKPLLPSNPADDIGN